MFQEDPKVVEVSLTKAFENRDNSKSLFYYTSKLNKSYTELKNYYEKEGNTSVPNRDTLLGNWCRKNRDLYKKGKLSQEKIDLLEKINFLWEPLEHQWSINYQELKKYYVKEKILHIL